MRPTKSDSRSPAGRYNAAGTLAELEAEIVSLEQLEAQADRLHRATRHADLPR
jgi:hypothetical protein